MAKFDNTNTTIKALVIDIEAMTKNEVEFTTDIYTRSEAKAEQLIREGLDIESDAIVKVTEIVHETDEPKKYAVARMIHDGYTPEIGNSSEHEYNDDVTVIDFVQYVYTANVFYENEDNEPFATKYTTSETISKLTKGNARDYVKMVFETENEEMKVVKVTNNHRFELEYYFAVTADVAATYEM